MSSAEQAIHRLNHQLPLAARQRNLPSELTALHRAILRSLHTRGRALTRDEVAASLTSFSLQEALLWLASADLIVLSTDAEDIVGAYPMTTEPTPHRLVFPDHTIHAMCALDALSVTPMFGGSVDIHSECRVTRQPIEVEQHEERIVAASPAGVLVGIRWQMPCGGHAAHSMCMEMVFLGDEAAANAWHGGDLDRHSLFTLPDAVELGGRFFKPLVR